MKSSQHLEVGRIYSRKELQQQFDIQDATIKNGIFQPRGHDSVWLFVTEQKASDRTQYEDSLQGDDLQMDGQTMHRTDRLLIEHEARSLELLLFHREKKTQYENAGFRYEGRFSFLSHDESQPGKPTHFHFRRMPIQR